MKKGKKRHLQSGRSNSRRAWASEHSRSMFCASHEVAMKLPAVSGSSGCLVVERLRDDQENRYPGRVFEDQFLDYAEAMRAFVAVSAHAK